MLKGSFDFWEFLRGDEWKINNLYFNIYKYMRIMGFLNEYVKFKEVYIIFRYIRMLVFNLFFFIMFRYIYKIYRLSKLVIF